MLRAIAAVAALLVALCLATETFAHASLVAAEPADGSVVAESPKTVQLQFNESVTPAVVNLIDAAGKTRAVTVRAVDQSVVIVLPDDLPRGTQVVSYRVVSQDGHPVGGIAGVFDRRCDGQRRQVEWRPGCDPDLAGPHRGLCRLVRRRRRRVLCRMDRAGSGARVITGALAVGVASAVASLGLQGLDLLDRPLGGLATSAPWTSALGTSLGPSLLIAIASMVIAGFAWRSPTGMTARVLTVLAMAGVGLSLATSGHAATASPKSLTAPAMFVHGVAIAFWVGALAPLVVLARQSTGAVVPVLQRFSRLAVPVVGLLVLSGLGLAIIQLESVGALIETRYGNILLVKLILVTVLLGLAALNRYRLTPAVAADPQNTRPLIGSILIECVVVVGILAVVAAWRFTPPPRVLAAAAQAPLAIHIHTEKAMAQVSISPGKVGSDDFVLQLLTGDFGALSAKEATLTLSLPERGIEPFEREAKRGPDGYWHVRGVPLPLAGRWHMRIDVLVTDFEKVTLEGEFDLR